MCHFTGVKKDRNGSRDSRRRVCCLPSEQNWKQRESFALTKIDSESERKFICIFFVGKVNVIPICQSKYNSSPVLRSLSDFHCTIRFTHTFFLFYFQSAKCSRLPWLCLCPNTWEAVLGLNSGTTAGVCLLSVLIGWFFHPPSFTLTNQNSEKSPALEFFCCRETADLSHLNLYKLINKQVFI